MTVSEGGHQSTKGGSKKFQYGNNQNPPEPLPSFFTSPLPPSTLLPSPFPLPLPPSPSPRRQIMAVFLISLALSLSFSLFLAFFILLLLPFTILLFLNFYIIFFYFYSFRVYYDYCVIFYRVSFYANCIRYRFNVSNKFSTLVIQQPRLTCKFESEKKSPSQVAWSYVTVPRVKQLSVKVWVRSSFLR